VVKLDGSESGLTFEVADDGCGFDSASVKRGAGLTNMTDRIEALGGRLEVSSTLTAEHVSRAPCLCCSLLFSPETRESNSLAL
jgi:signal transduction histidine kinase